MCVNIASIEYQKRVDRKEKTKTDKIETKRKILERLKEISLELENGLSTSFTKYKQIQNNCSIFSSQLTNILSKVAYDDIPEELIDDLNKLTLDLKDFGNHPIYSGYDFVGECKSIIETTKEITQKIENT